MKSCWRYSRKSSKDVIATKCRRFRRRNGSCNMAEMPAVPVTVEGSWVLHQMFRFRRTAWRALDSAQQDTLLADAARVLAPMEQGSTDGHPNQSAAYSLIG